jgi:FAD/FMN-containing dehydrogenase
VRASRLAQWTKQRETQQHIAWAKETFETLRPHMTDRSYVNNLTTEDGRKVHEVWGANYRRLVTFKRRYDPGNVFRLNHNIDPLA